jgi:hypothetical protein
VLEREWMEFWNGGVEFDWEWVFIDWVFWEENL